ARALPRRGVEPHPGLARPAGGLPGDAVEASALVALPPQVAEHGPRGRMGRTRGGRAPGHPAGGTPRHRAPPPAPVGSGSEMRLPSHFLARCFALRGAFVALALSLASVGCGG